MGQDVEWAGA